MLILKVFFLLPCSGNHSCSAGSVQYNDTDPCWGGALSRKSAYRVFLVSSCSHHQLRDAGQEVPGGGGQVLLWDVPLKLACFDLLLCSALLLLLFSLNE